jgi:MFS family permease
VIFGLLLFWSGVSLTTAFIHTEGELILNRFILGVSEGGVLTCTLVLIRAWFTRAERARANTLFLLSLAVAPLVAGPISGLILSLSDWRWMFILEAAPALVWAIVWVVAISDDPRTAPWLPTEERGALIPILDAENNSIVALPGHWLATLWHPAVLLLALYNFLALMAEWGVNFWLPSVLKETGLSIGIVGLLAAIPYALGVVAMIVVAASSDRLQERKWHMIVMTGASGLAMMMLLFPAGNQFATICLLSLAIGLFLGRFGPFWTLPTEVLPPAVVGVGIGLVNGAGNLGGTVGPYFFGYVRTATGSFTLALAVAGVSLVLGALVAVPIRVTRRARGIAPTMPSIPSVPGSAR